MSYKVGRRNCGICGTELPAYSGRGRPEVYCGPACARVPKLLRALATASEEILGAVPQNKRETVLRGIRGSLRVLAEDLAMTTAELNGDTERAARVGKEIPAGFDARDR